MLRAGPNHFPNARHVMEPAVMDVMQDFSRRTGFCQLFNCTSAFEGQPFRDKRVGEAPA